MSGSTSMKAALASLSRRLPPRARDELIHSIFGAPSLRQWLREPMNRDFDRIFRELQPERCDAVEVSGTLRAEVGWRSYRRLEYPAFDLCTEQPTESFDVVICEQVLEHVVDPFAAARTLAALCRPGGHLVVSVPFLVKLHGSPGDYWRFTPDGLRVLLEQAGLQIEQLHSWGNRRAASKNLRTWLPYRPWRSLRDQPGVPLVVWAVARRP